MNILLTGGTGYIGSHTAVALIEAGYRVVLFDNLCNSDASVVDRLEKITGQRLSLVVGDVRDKQALVTALDDHRIDAVMHFAGLKAVAESVREPLKYYDNNVNGSLSLLQAMQQCGQRTLVFSSSATVYGEPQYLPIDEVHPTNPINPYGWSKLAVERILTDLANSDPTWRIACLRYFNPVGAHPSGLIGESPRGEPNNLMPYIAQVAAGLRDELRIFGNDYPTSDGTGVRDYVHVADLARGHANALESISTGGRPITVNLGSGQGTSVKALVEVFSKVTGAQIAFSFAPRRLGDLAATYTSASAAESAIGWVAQQGLEAMCSDTWRWQRYSASNASST